MMACTLCKLVSGDNKIPLNTYADFKKRQRNKREGMMMREGVVMRRRQEGQEKGARFFLKKVNMYCRIA